MAEYCPEMEKRAEWPARGRAAVSPFPGDILPSRTVHVPFLKMGYLLSAEVLLKVMVVVR